MSIATIFRSCDWFQWKSWHPKHELHTFSSTRWVFVMTKGTYLRVKSLQQWIQTDSLIDTRIFSCSYKAKHNYSGEVIHQYRRCTYCYGRRDQKKRCISYLWLGKDHIWYNPRKVLVSMGSSDFESYPDENLSIQSKVHPLFYWHGITTRTPVIHNASLHIYASRLKKYQNKINNFN